MADPQAAMCIIELDGTACGLLRLDPHRTERQYEISILVSTRYQGRGIGRAALKFASLLVPWADLLAYVKADNAKSQRAFLAAGFESDSAGYLVLQSRLGRKNG